MAVGLNINPSDFSHDNPGGGLSPLSPLDAIAGGSSDSLESGVSSAADILSGNRDRRFNREEADKAYWRQRELLQDKAGLEMAGLAAAGINPILAGSGFSGSAPSVQAASSSGSGSSLASAINSAGSIISSVTGLRKMLAELPNLKAQARKTNAEAHYTEASTQDNLRLLGARIPEVEANTAHSRAMSFLKELDAERGKAEQAYYKRYGYSAVLADKNKNPWQSAQLVAAQTGRVLEENPESVDRALNSATDVAAKSIQHAAEQEAKRSERFNKRRSPISGRHYMNWR